MDGTTRDLLKQAVLDDRSFVRAVFSGQQRGAELAWQKVVVRPVVLKNQRHLQFSFFDAVRDITKNYPRDESASALDEVLGKPFRNFYVQSTTGDLQVTFSKKGKPSVTRHRPTQGEQAPVVDLAHDRQKARIISADESAPFLRAVGIMTADGRIRANRQDKFRQINEFIKLVQQTGVPESLGAEPVHVVDLGCGNAYLTFALYFYLSQTLGLDVRMTGADVKGDLLRRHEEKVRELGWTGLTFERSRIIDFEPETPPDIVTALHACDTATDEALAKGIQWGSRLIVAAPCCQHDLQSQLCDIPRPSPFRSVWRDGILSERLGDVLTDTFRAVILRVMGYDTDVVQFISTEHTAKNLMIRAVRAREAGDPGMVREYLALKEYWQVTPHLEQLLGDSFVKLLSRMTPA